MISDDDIIETTSSTSSSSPHQSDEIHLSIKNAISIENIQEETNLIHYTENHFNTKIQQDLDKIRDMHITNTASSFYIQNKRSNSPITISNFDSHSNSNNSNSNSSDSDSNNYDTDDDEVVLSNHGYKKLSYKDVEKMIHKYYDFNIDNKISNEIDILTTYIRGQKNLYIQSKHFTQRRLNCLMFPSLLISAFITMIAPFFECNSWSGGLISALNGVIMLCVSFINYLKLESSIENYLYNVKQYDKLETSLEMTNNKLMFIESKKEKSSVLLNKIRDVERKISEIKESNTSLIPEDVKILFPIICHINIFSFIKKVEIIKKNLILKFKDVKNEIRYILFKQHFDNSEPEKYNSRLVLLHEVKNKLKTEIFEFLCAYSHIDNIFTKEIKNAELRQGIWYSLCFFDKKTKNNNYDGINPIIDKFFRFIFADE
jgi:hypothetical protein